MTLVGESAGGASVLQWLTSSAAAGLFHRAVVMSGGGRKALAAQNMTGGTPDAPSADQADMLFAKSLGVEGVGPDALAALRALPAEKLVGDVSLLLVLKAALAGVPIVPGTPLLDGVLVTGQPGDILGRVEGAPVPLIIGTTALDLPLFFPPDRTNPFAWFGADAENAVGLYNPGGALPPELVVLGLSSDMTMHEPARFVAKAMRKAGNAAWLYRFSYVAEGIADRAKGAAHAQELPYLFDTLDARYGGDAVTENDRAVASAFSSAIANFAKTGDPNGAGAPEWPMFDPTRFDLMDFTLDDGPVFGPDPRAPRIELVEQAFAQSVQADASLPAEVAGSVWEWVSFVSPVEEIYVDEPRRYTLQFDGAGRVALRADCNRGSGSYTVEADRRLAFGPVALTRAACPPGSLSDRFAQEVNRAASFFLMDGDLYLELPVDSFRRQQ